MTRLEQIKSRLEKATPGPWSTDDESINCGSDTLALFSDKTSNLRFIANAPTDIKYLISQLKEASKILKEVEEIPNDRNEDISTIAQTWRKKWNKEIENE